MGIENLAQWIFSISFIISIPMMIVLWHGGKRKEVFIGLSLLGLPTLIYKLFSFITNII